MYACPNRGDWQPISTVPHVDGNDMDVDARKRVLLLWAEGARVNAWEWSEDRQRWEGMCGIYWYEGEFGPTDWMPMPNGPR